MPDPRSAMKEFRSLEQKRSAGGLTPDEEARYEHLRDLVAPDAPPPPPRGGFDVEAAAAQLRESLLPAGLRNVSPAVPAPEATGVPDAPSAVQAFADAYSGSSAPSAPWAPHSWNPNAAQAAEGWDPSAQAYDPSAQPYDPNAQAYDPSTQPYDPNAQAYDDPSTQPYDPNAQAYDPNAQPYDPNAQAYDPSGQPYDPNAQAYDPSAQPYDPNAQAYYDPSAQPYDPNAQAYDPAQPYDPNAQAYDPSAQPYDPNAQAYYDPSAQPYDPNAQAQTYTASQAAWDAAPAYDADEAPGASAGTFDPNASPEAGAQAYPAPDPSATSEADLLAEPASAAGAPEADPAALPPEGWAALDAASSPAEASAMPPGEDAGLESLLPFDPAAAAAIPAGEVPEGFGDERGEYDDTAGFERRYAEPAPDDLPPPDAGFHAAQSVESEATEGWQPDAALEEGFQLESGGSFDAAAEAAAPEWAGGNAARPWEAAPADAGVASPEAGPLEEELEEATIVAVDDFAVDVEDPVDATPAAFEPELEAPAHAAAAPEERAAPAVRLELAPEPRGVEPAPFEAGEAAAGPVEPVPPEDAAPSSEPEAAFPVAGAEEASLAPEPVASSGGAALAEAAPASLDDESIPTIEGEDILEEIPPEEVELVSDELAAPPPAEPPRVEREPDAVRASEPVATSGPVHAPEPEAEPPQASAPEPSAAEHLPAPAAPPAPPPHAAPPDPTAAEPSPAATGCQVPGAHRVVVHTVEGHVKRGVLEDADLAGANLLLSPQPGGAATEAVASDRVKAIFFMLAPGEQALPPEGKKVRVTFRDGRQVAGFSPDYDEAGIGFFMIPVDTRTNTGRIWVYRAAVRQVSVS